MTTYHGKPCAKCGGTLRRKSGRGCVNRLNKDHLSAKMAATKNEISARFRDTHREKLREYAKSRREADPNYARRWREANPEYQARYWQANAERLNAYQRAYYQENKESQRPYRRAAQAARRAAKGQRTPPWADKSAIAAIYAACPPGHHVDHIVPLRGAQVSGLHVPENLQYLPAEMNLRKSNKFNPTGETLHDE